MPAVTNLSLIDRLRLKASAKLMRVLLGYFPKEPTILARLGTIELAFENLGEAERLLRSSLEINSTQPDAWLRRALALEGLNRRREALQCYNRAVSLRPGFTEAEEARGALIARGGQLDSVGATPQSTKSKSLKSLKSKDVEALIGQGNRLFDSGKSQEALRYFERVIALRPDHAKANYIRGSVLYQLRRFGEALASFDRAIAAKKDWAEVHRNRGVALAALGRFEEAIQSTDRALQLEPHEVQARYNRAHILMQANRVEEAIVDYDRAIAIKADYVSAHWNKALCLLLAGKFEQGLLLHELRWKKWGTDPTTMCGVTLPLWLGEASVDGKTVLVQHEQGLGDFIQFCRYVPLIEELGGKVVMMVPAALAPLVSTVSETATVVAHGQPLPKCDYTCPVVSLPLSFKTTERSILAETPYLSVDATRQTYWRERLGARSSLRVGLAWSGNTFHENDHNRSIPLEQLKPIFDLPLEFHVVQKDLRPEDMSKVTELSNVHEHSAHLRNFADAAALVGEMDLIISVDTAAAHLAGALAKPVWILLPFAPDWRWMLNRADSPWYPTARLFRQPKPGDWTSVITDLKTQLEAWDVAIKPVG